MPKHMAAKTPIGNGHTNARFHQRKRLKNIRYGNFSNRTSFDTSHCMQMFQYFSSILFTGVPTSFLGLHTCHISAPALTS